MTAETIRFAYTNYRGEPSVRTVIIRRFWFGSTEYHPDKQWMFTAYDLDRKANRDFALCDCDFSVAEHVS